MYVQASGICAHGTYGRGCLARSGDCDVPSKPAQVVSLQDERRPVAFVHMRWEKDDTEGWPILYCYDIQLEPCVQRKGLGK